MLSDIVLNFITQYSFSTLIFAVAVSFYCVRTWQHMGLLRYWLGRLLCLWILVLVNSFLYDWQVVYLPFFYPLLGMQGIRFLIWFIRGYGLTIVNELKVNPMTMAKQQCLGVLMFLTLLGYWLNYPESNLDPGLHLLAQRAAPSLIFVFSWLLRFVWGALISEGGWTYSDFTNVPYAPWLPAVCIQGIFFINSFLWGNQLRDFIVTQLHPNIILACVGFCSLTAVYSMGQQLYAYLKKL